MQSRHVLPAVLAVLAATGAARAQDTFIYAYGQQGRVSANGYELDDLPSGNSGTKDEVWHDLFVQGPDRWLIRGDGKIVLNGGDVVNLDGDNDWRGIVVNDQGTFYAMKKGGTIHDPSGKIKDYPADDFSFMDIETNGTDVFVLKTNGSVYRVPEDGPLFRFNGSGEDGDPPDKLWVRLQVHPLDGTLWALRKDGVIMSAVVPATPPDPLDSIGVEEASLPFDDDSDELIDEFYDDFTFEETGTWFALRADGRLYSTANPANPPLFNYPGAPTDGIGQTYQSIVAREGETVALRLDGRIYSGMSSDVILDLKGTNYVGLVLGDVFPDLVNVKNEAPTGSSTTVTAPEGADIELPVLAIDTDLPAEDLVVEVSPDTPLPVGATWVPETRTISWPDAGPVGKYKIKVTVSDGIAKPVNTTQSITIKALDVNEGKNIKPAIAKVSKAVALVGVPFTLPVQAYDLDGTVPDLSVDVSKDPLPAGASFDTVTGILTWDAPLVSDTGTVSFKFLAMDGTAVGKRTIKVKVQTSLLGF